jgi:hypothetical protein
MEMMFSREDLQQFGLVQFLAGLPIPWAWDFCDIPQSSHMNTENRVETGHDYLPKPYPSLFSYLIQSLNSNIKSFKN